MKIAALEPAALEPAALEPAPAPRMVAVDVFRDPAETRLGRTVSALVFEVSQLEALLPAAYEQQWSARPSRDFDEGESTSSSGMTSDPTGAIATDTGRLQLRAEVVQAERVLDDAALAVQVATRRLADALG